MQEKNGSLCGCVCVLWQPLRAHSPVLVQQVKIRSDRKAISEFVSLSIK